jgi:hypothetical protein
MKELKKELETELAKSETKIQVLEKQLAEAKIRTKEREKKIEELNKLVSLDSQKQTSVSQTFIYEKTLDFLKTKSIFLNARRETIEELQKCYNK